MQELKRIDNYARFNKGSESDINLKEGDVKEYVRDAYHGCSNCLTSHFCFSPCGVNGGWTTMGAWLHGVRETTLKLLSNVE